MTYTPFNYKGPIIKSHGRNLPHWDVDRGVYFITICLQDSVPAKVQQKLKQKRTKEISKLEAANKLTTEKLRELDDELHFERDIYLDAGHGSRLFQTQPRAAEILAESLEFFHDDRYHLKLWSIMPTHAHVNVQFETGWRLRDILHSWKSFTTNRIQKELGWDGELWQDDFYDRLIRSWEEFERYARYTWENPIRAGLKDWPWVRQYKF